MHARHIIRLLALGLAVAPLPAIAGDAFPRVGPQGGAPIDGAILRDVPVGYARLRGRARRHAKEARPHPLATVKGALKAGYRPLSDLTGGAYPAFTPAVGAVYARKDAMPLGPFLAYDRRGRHVGTIYKFPLDRLAAKGGFEAPGLDMAPVDHVSGYEGGSHPGADFPHYNYVFWHVSRDEAKALD